MTNLFYQNSPVPSSLGNLCSTDGGVLGLAMNQALLASTNSSVPLLQVSNLQHDMFSHDMLVAAVGQWLDVASGYQGPRQMMLAA